MNQFYKRWVEEKSNGFHLPNATKYPQVPPICGTFIHLNQRLKGIKIPFHNLEFIGCGANGIAYVLPDHRVVKITYSEEEAATAAMLINHSHPFIVPIYSVSELTNDVWMIINKRLVSLSLQDENIADKIFNENDDERVDILDDLDGNELCFGIKYLEFLENLKDSGFDCQDAHPGNIGWRGNNLALFDLGDCVSEYEIDFSILDSKFVNRS
jgi:hypothetical protein